MLDRTRLMAPTYYGETACPSFSASGKECKNKAYWLVTDEDGLFVRFSCGVHSKNTNRKPLPKRSRADQAKITENRRQQEKKDIEQARLDNAEGGQKGHLIVTKLRMFSGPEDHEGYLKVFPNFRHGNRKDGLGLPELSPMSLGPVETPQPSVPVAKNIENLHQFNKVFPSEIGEDGNPTEEWYQTRSLAYQDPVPHRHKPSAKSAKGSKNIPEYSVWETPDGEELHLSYFESRQIYCTYYERLAKKTESFATLKDLIENGTNIQIVGYDGYDLGMEVGASLKEKEQKFLRCYKDTSKPFGHELVLAALLELTPKRYPWRKFTTLEL